MKEIRCMSFSFSLFLLSLFPSSSFRVSRSTLLLHCSFAWSFLLFSTQQFFLLLLQELMVLYPFARACSSILVIRSIKSDCTLDWCERVIFTSFVSTEDFRYFSVTVRRVKSINPKKSETLQCYSVQFIFFAHFGEKNDGIRYPLGGYFSSRRPKKTSLKTQRKTKKNWL